MKNPWEEIALETYEKHMSLDSVRQLQALDRIMAKQLTAYNTESGSIFRSCRHDTWNDASRRKASTASRTTLPKKKRPSADI